MTFKTSIKLRVAKKKGDKTTPELHFAFGETLDDAAHLFGTDTVHALFVSAARQQLAEWARKLLTRKKTPLSLEQLQTSLDLYDWTPGLKKRGKSPLEKAAAFLETMSPEERAKLVEIAKTFAPKNGPTGSSPMPNVAIGKSES